MRPHFTSQQDSPRNIKLVKSGTLISSLNITLEDHETHNPDEINLALQL